MARESKIVDLSPAVGDGVTTVFTTPTAFAPGSLRTIVNGTEYGPGDDDFGFTEIDSTTIQLNVAPRPGDDVDAFYIELLGGAPTVIEGVGSPFSPSELC